ncbi:MAG: hypothetical protein LBU75_05500 [Desulfovibrio sp.]|jgi:hypothetical protein|nr:hypothetical protein [Desulfovibrio sp.]
MTATTRARFLRGLFSLGADLAGSAAGIRPAVPCPPGLRPPDAEGAGDASSPAAPVTEPAMWFSGGAPLCGPGGDFTPELLRLEAERLGLPADADAEDLLHRLHRAMLDMAPPGARAPEASGTATPDGGNSDTAVGARQTPGNAR